MEEVNLDVCESSVKKEPEDILSPPVEVNVCSDSPNVDEDEWVNSCSSEQFAADPLATTSLCDTGNEASITIRKFESFSSDPLKGRITLKSCNSPDRADPSNSMVHEELDLGACKVDDESGGISQKSEFSSPSTNIISLPPVNEDPDPEQTRRLLDSALQKIISNVTKRKGRKRRGLQPPIGEMKRQKEIALEFQSPSGQVTVSVLPLPVELGDPLSVPKPIPINASPINAITSPVNAKTTLVKKKSTPPTSSDNSEILQSDLLQLVQEFSGIDPSSANRPDMIPTEDQNLSYPVTKKPGKKRAKSFQQRRPSVQRISQITESCANLPTNFPPTTVSPIQEVSSVKGTEISLWRAKGGDPSPAGGTPASTGAIEIAEGAQEACDSRGLKTSLSGRLKELGIFPKIVSQEQDPQTRVAAKVNDGEKNRNMPSPTLPVSKLIVPRKSLLAGPTPVCDLCGRGFSSYCELMSHMRLHTSSLRRYFCSLCKCRFGHAQALASHARKRHGIEMQLLSAGGGQQPFAYSCNSCDLFFQKRAELNEHLIRVHGVVRSKLVKGVAPALIGQSRMRGAVAKDLGDTHTNSTPLNTSSFAKSNALTNLNVNCNEAVQLTSKSCFQLRRHSRLPSHGGHTSVSDLTVSRASSSSPTSIRSNSKSSVISSSSSSSSECDFSVTGPKFPHPGYQEVSKRRSKTTLSPRDCPVHDHSYLVMNSSNSSSKPAQLTSKFTTANKEKFEVKFPNGSECMLHVKKTNTVARDSRKGNYVYSKTKSYTEIRSNYSLQVTKGPSNATHKNLARTKEMPCPIHKTSVFKAVKDTVWKSSSEGIPLVKRSCAKSTSLRNSLPDQYSNDCTESSSSSVSDCESLRSYVSSHTSKSVSKGGSRSLSNSIFPTYHNCSKPVSMKRHSVSSYSSCSNRKSLKFQTTSDVNMSCLNTTPARNKIKRLRNVSENKVVSPVLNTVNNTCYSGPNLKNRKKNFSPSFSCPNPNILKNHISSDSKSSTCHTKLEHKKLQRSSPYAHSLTSTPIVALKKLSIPNLNSSISSAGDRQLSIPRHSSHTVANVSHFPRGAKKRADNTSFLHSRGDPIVVLERIDPLLTPRKA